VTQPAPLSKPHPPGSSSSTGPKSLSSSNSRQESRVTHSNSFSGSSFFGYREIGTREFAFHANTIFMHHQTPNPDGQRANPLSFIGDFPIGKSEVVVSCVSCHTKPRTPKLRLHATCPPVSPVVPHCHVNFGISRIANTRYKVPLVSKTPKRRTPISGI
jgi:hypothetical protein